jgi:hypothetical protein
MRENELKRLVNELNRGTGKSLIFRRQIGKYVEVAKYWDKKPSMKRARLMQTSSKVMFFIKNEHEQFVGVVYDMGYDLHWYVLPKFRGQGHLTKALKESVIPYLFEVMMCEEIKISIDIHAIGESNYAASRKVAEAIGFRGTNNSDVHFVLKSEDFDFSEYNEDNDKNNLLNWDEEEELKAKLRFLGEQVRLISDELMMRFEDDVHLQEYADALEDSRSRLEDLIYSIKNR